MNSRSVITDLVKWKNTCFSPSLHRTRAPRFMPNWKTMNQLFYSSSFPTKWISLLIKFKHIVHIQKLQMKLLLKVLIILMCLLSFHSMNIDSSNGIEDTSFSNSPLKPRYWLLPYLRFSLSHVLKAFAVESWSILSINILIHTQLKDRW